MLWLIFPARLLAESITCALHGGGGFLTGTIGEWMAHHVNPIVLQTLYEPLWWAYSICLGLFFIVLPFSRYMHIFTEIPLIFLRRYKLHSTEKEGSFDRFQTDACSRCGICIDPCQLQSELGIDDVQSVYFLRDRRYNHLRQSVANNCLMCGRCEQRCPVGIELNTLRLNSRDTMRNTPDEKRYEYFQGVDRSAGEGRVGYFAGCMTLLTPRILLAMERIFKASGEEVWWADKEGGVCCGRPLKLSGETDSARKMMDYNIALFRKHRITTLVTSCPDLPEGIPGGVSSRRNRSAAPFRVYAAIDPGRPPTASPRGADIHLPRPLRTGTRERIYDQPREVIEAVGVLLEPAQTREHALCCGSSVANTAISDAQQLRLARSVAKELSATGAGTIVTACPLCKKAIARGADGREVLDLAEVVAAALVSKTVAAVPDKGV